LKSHRTLVEQIIDSEKKCGRVADGLRTHWKIGRGNRLILVVRREMQMLNMLSLVSCVLIAIPNGDDHVSRHQVDIEALQSHAAHVRILSDEPASKTEGKPVGRRISAVYIPEESVGGDDGLTPIDHIFLTLLIVTGQPHVWLPYKPEAPASEHFATLLLSWMSPRSVTLIQLLRTCFRKSPDKRS
jgi:hypothetical protein